MSQWTVIRNCMVVTQAQEEVLGYFLSVDPAPNKAHKIIFVTEDGSKYTWIYSNDWPLKDGYRIYGMDALSVHFRSTMKEAIANYLSGRVLSDDFR